MTRQQLLTVLRCFDEGKGDLMLLALLEPLASDPERINETLDDDAINTIIEAAGLAE